MPHELRVLLFYAIYALIALILIEVVVSNVIAFGGRLSPYHPAVRLLRQIVNPILNPVRRLLPPPHKTGGWDLSPMLIILLLQVLIGIIR